MLILKNVKKAYHNREVIKNLSITFETGEFVIILGQSGSGKTTLLNMMSSMERADSGKILFLGTDLNKMTGNEISLYRNQSIGICFQFFHLFEDLTVEENIYLPKVILNQCKNEIYVDKLIVALNIRTLFKKYPAELSGGEKQKVALARSLIMNPKILFLDEPTGSLDSLSGTEIMEIIHNLHREFKPLIIMVTHNLDFIKYGTRILELKDGEIIHEEFKK